MQPVSSFEMERKPILYEQIFPMMLSHHCFSLLRLIKKKKQTKLCHIVVKHPRLDQKHFLVNALYKQLCEI